jgi:hypothetical protein
LLRRNIGSYFGEVSRPRRLEAIPEFRLTVVRAKTLMALVSFNGLFASLRDRIDYYDPLEETKEIRVSALTVRNIRVNVRQPAD